MLEPSGFIVARPMKNWPFFVLACRKRILVPSGDQTGSPDPLCVSWISLPPRDGITSALPVLVAPG